MNFFQIWRTLFNFDDLFLNLMNYFQNLWTFFKFDELFSKTMNFFQIRRTFFFEFWWTFSKFHELLWNLMNCFHFCEMCFKISERFSEFMNLIPGSTIFSARSASSKRIFYVRDCYMLQQSSTAANSEIFSATTCNIQSF